MRRRFREASGPERLFDFVARLLSTILSPFVIALPLVLAVILRISPSFTKTAQWLLVSLLFALVIPLAAILVLRQTGEVTDVHLSLRPDRPFPFVFTIFSGLIGTYLLLVLGAPRLFMTLALSFIFLGIGITVITLFWKVSVHLAAVSATLTAALLVFGLSVAPWFLTLLALGWARIYLKEHTGAQVVGGAVQAAVSMTLTFLARELI